MRRDFLCPECGCPVEPSRVAFEAVGSGLQYRSLLCPNCRERLSFLLDTGKGVATCWSSSRESKYRLFLREKLGTPRNILYAGRGADRESLAAAIRAFCARYTRHAGVVLSQEFEELVEPLQGLYRIALLPTVLFPESPSFLAERILLQEFEGHSALFAACPVLTAEKFAKWEVLP